jgi:hypothetical protein
MRLGISYNVFDGEELLESSIKLIRDNVDFISVVYQTTSNFGNQCSEELVPLLHRLKNESEDYTLRIIPFIIKNNVTFKYFDNISEKNLSFVVNNTLKNNRT